jgi:unsaturated chondroitin disaccharide hydrolase
MCYRETKERDFLDFAQKVANVYLSRLPEDYIPYWDFDAPNIPNEPKDASAAAITASAILELSTFIEDKTLSETYKNSAVKMLESLNRSYLSKEKNSAFLLHSTGHWPNGSEIDVSISYADYYFIEALLRYKKITQGKPILSKLEITND